MDDLEEFIQRLIKAIEGESFLFNVSLHHIGWRASEDRKKEEKKEDGPEFISLGWPIRCLFNDAFCKSPSSMLAPHPFEPPAHTCIMPTGLLQWITRWSSESTMLPATGKV
jgi:hypothetical protein